MYVTFFTYKILFSPNKVFNEICRIFVKNFKTKMEMSIYKVIKLRSLYYFPFLYSKKVQLKDG